MDHVDVINRLLSRGSTQAELERLLNLSPNYISKLRHRAATPSFQLSALLAVVERHPEVLSTIKATPRPTKGSTPPQPPRPSSPKSPTKDLLSLVPVIEASGARYGLLGVGAHIADDDGELDLVVHDADRHVLSSLREAGFQCAHFSNSLFECYRTDAHIEDDGFNLHFPSLPPLNSAFSNVDRKRVRGVEANVIAATDTALSLLLSRREDGLERARRLVDHQLTSTDELRHALAATHSLPQTRSTFILQVFDRDLASQRLAEIERAR